MNDDLYRALAEHLDRLPGGFPPSKTGAELPLLKRLFTPEEAALAVHVTLERAEPAVIARRVVLPLSEVEPRLEQMAQKGLIFSVKPPQGSVLYQAAPFVVGIYEFQVNNLDGALIGDLNEYWGTLKRRAPVRTIPQMRTIPVEASIATQREVLAYDHIEGLLAAQDRFAVAHCICRKEATLSGRGCDAPEETCLVFGDWADYYVRTGRARAIDLAEVRQILTAANDAGLVLQPSNSREIAFICCCCGCCCGILQGLKHRRRPADAVVSSFLAQFEATLCSGCFICVDRCQMQALAVADGQIEYSAERCIGCGLCVTTCPTGALTLVRKPEADASRVPETLEDTWRVITDAQAAQRDRARG
ncbi:4Fe-4S binding protein [Candidatus Fermentibacteria bacterium]|nr:4Fe-4S binding protein [Candidatus Fermentibacteria bacterium]